MIQQLQLNPAKLASLALCVAVFGISVPASSQKETDLGSRISRPKRAETPDLGYTKEESSRITFREFARCTFAKSPAKVASILMEPPGSDPKTLGNLASRSDCLSGGILTFNSMLFRGALFGEMYRVRQKSPDRAWTYPVPPIDLENVPGAQSPDDVKVNYFLMDMSDCLYKKDPEAVKAVVMEPTASKTQKAAFDRVIAQLGPCVPQGLTMKFSRSIIETTLGEYLYRSLVPKVQPKEGTAR